MKIFLKELIFPSTRSTYFRDITGDINKAIKEASIDIGFVFINTKHTTMGIVVNEVAEPNLLEDILEYTLRAIPEDKRSSRVSKDYKLPTTDYRHRCQDNPYCDEVDEDYNAAAHIRALAFSHPSVVVPIKEGKLDLGKYQQVAALEFDGRDGNGKNPIRERHVQILIMPAEKIIHLD